MDETHKVVPGGTSTEERTGDPDMATAGTRFDAYVKAAMSEQGLTLAELARRTGIAASAWHAWFRGDHQPRRNSLVLAGRTLHRTPDQLAAAWSGGRVKAAVVPEDALRRTVDDHEVRLRALEAELRSLRELLAAGASPGQGAPHETTG